MPTNVFSHRASVIPLLIGAIILAGCQAKPAPPKESLARPTVSPNLPPDHPSLAPA